MTWEVSPFPFSGYYAFVSLSDGRSFWCRKWHCQQLRLPRYDEHGSTNYSKFRWVRLKFVELPQRFLLPSSASDYNLPKIFGLLKNLSVMSLYRQQPLSTCVRHKTSAEFILNKIRNDDTILGPDIFFTRQQWSCRTEFRCICICSFHSFIKLLLIEVTLR